MLNEDMLVFAEEYLDDAIIGETEDGRPVYDFERLLDAIVNNTEMDESEADDWIGYNMIRSLPYLPASRRPVILFRYMEVDDSEID